jgi:hypothetical protein
MSQQNQKSQHLQPQEEEENGNELGEPELSMAALQVQTPNQ